VTLVRNGFTQVAKDYAAWQADAVKHAAKPLFYAMNVSEPPQYASIGQQVEDTMLDVRYGRKPISAFTAAVDAWRKQGGDKLRDFYDGIRSKYGTGQ
jgi:putative aldouronate transport system substrate-binding protein